MVVTNDTGDYDNIHPSRKQEVGIRLAGLALGDTYGKPGKGYQSPVLENTEIRKNKVLLYFRHTENGLTCRGKTPEGLQIAGQDGNFVTAKARFVQESCLEVYSSQVKRPTAVRYCFDDSTVGQIYPVAGNGLPVARFRTDK